MVFCKQIGGAGASLLAHDPSHDTAQTHTQHDTPRSSADSLSEQQRPLHEVGERER